MKERRLEIDRRADSRTPHTHTLSFSHANYLNRRSRTSARRHGKRACFAFPARAYRDSRARALPLARASARARTRPSLPRDVTKESRGRPREIEFYAARVWSPFDCLLFSSMCIPICAWSYIARARRLRNVCRESAELTMINNARSREQPVHRIYVIKRVVRRWKFSTRGGDAREREKERNAWAGVFRIANDDNDDGRLDEDLAKISRGELV